MENEKWRDTVNRKKSILCVLTSQLRHILTHIHTKKTRSSNSFVQWKIVFRIDTLRIFFSCSFERNFYWNEMLIIIFLFFFFFVFCCCSFFRVQCEPVRYSNVIYNEFHKWQSRFSHIIFSISFWIILKWWCSSQCCCCWVLYFKRNSIWRLSHTKTTVEWIRLNFMCVCFFLCVRDSMWSI